MLSVLLEIFYRSTQKETERLKRNVINGESLFPVLNYKRPKSNLVICVKLNSLTVYFTDGKHLNSQSYNLVKQTI